MARGCYGLFQRVGAAIQLDQFFFVTLVEFLLMVGINGGTATGEESCDG